MLGSWSAAGVAAQAVTLRQGLERALGKDGRIIHARGANVTDDAGMIKYLNFLNWDRPEVVQDPRPPQAMIDEAVRAAREADVIVAALGEARGMSHESSSRTSLTLPASQQALLEALVATGKPLVVVLMNGRPLQLGWVRSMPMRCWKPGSPEPRAAMPSPMCCSARTTLRASCRSPFRVRWGRFPPTTTIHGWAALCRGASGQLHLAIFRVSGLNG